MFLYLDTSALVKLYVEEEEGRDPVRRAVAESERISTSVVAYTETRAALAHRQREGIFTAEQLREAVGDLDRDWAGFFKVAASNSLAHLAGEIAERYALRGFDAIHPASARRLEERFDDFRRLLRLLAFDDRLTDAAKAASMLVYPSEPLERSYFRRTEYPPNG